MLYHAELLVCSDVEQPAGGVVRPCGESVPVREELRNGGRVILTTQQKMGEGQIDKSLTTRACWSHRDSIDVRLMASEGLFADAVAHIPKLTRKKHINFGYFSPIKQFWQLQKVSHRSRVKILTFAEASQAPETKVL